MTVGAEVTQDTTRARRDTTRAASDSAAQDTVRTDSTLTLDLRTRLEARAERNKNERCIASQLFNSRFTCQARIAPTLDFQYALRSSGGFSDRVHVAVDYDSQREFDGSNNISLYYEGKPGELLRRVEIGNVSFAPPPSRFITAGIPSGNYGVQAIAERGRLRMSVIAAQQKGNVIRDQVFTIGARASQRQEREIEDYQVEPRRFFFTIDPTLLAGYPNIDILNARQLELLASQLPDTVRPSRVFVYRLILGGQPPNPNGPRFRLLEDPASRSGQVYELLRENVDYYLDPSNLWLALVRPLALANERLVVAYTLRIAGRDTTIARLGGTPDLEFVPEREQVAHLLWDPQVTPDHPSFRREIRSVYRLGGEDVRRETVALRIVTGAGTDQEKPPGGAAETYLKLFGIAQVTNPSTFDAENRLWPRPNDPNIAVSSAPGALVIRDRFLVFPSIEPFARRGLASPPSVPANDTLYRTPSEYLYSPQHPQSFYRIRVAYETEGGAGAGTLALASVQIRPGSEYLTLDGRPLARGIDYEIDYDLGRVVLLRPDTLSLTPRRLVARYEENPLFASIPTTVVGFASQYTLGNGSIGFTAVSQAQRTTFTRPPLGLEPQSSIVAGINAGFGWHLPVLGRALARLAPRRDSVTAPRLDLRAELAVSRPRQNGAQQAYLESFEGDGGLGVSLFDSDWYYSSQPSLGRTLAARFGPETFDTTRATTLAYQSNGLNTQGRAVVFRITDIDSLATLAGTGFAPPEQILWLSLYPLGIGGLRDADDGAARYRWLNPVVPTGRRWRSIRVPLGTRDQTGNIGGSGVDLSRAEHIEFWTLVDTLPANRAKNPVLVLDFGDVSENSVALAPDTLHVAGADSTYRGRHLVHFDTLDTERDPFSRAFSAEANDTGLPGDVARPLVVLGGSPPPKEIPICQSALGQVLPLGDANANCTVHNNQLDEEDVDQDAVLNYPSAQREQEKVRRYVVDLSQRATYNRTGRCGAPVNDVNGAVKTSPTLCWVQVRVPFNAPEDSTNGGPLIRRVRALRLTMISGAFLPDGDFSLLPIVRLRLTGATWLKRAARPVHGIAGDETAPSGYVIASVIGTQDRDSLRGLVYEPPPGVTDEAEQQQIGTPTTIQVNERSLRLLAGGLARYDRAEAYFRFTEGQRSVMSYRELRVWARGRGNGWSQGTTAPATVSSDLQFFVKLGRDANNFYMYRTSVNAGPNRSAWLPEVRVRFERFFALRAQLQNAWLADRHEPLGCTAVDSALIAASGVPAGTRIDRFAACADGYVVYTIDPAVAPPNLAAVQELAVGMVRVDSLRGVNPLMPGDTAEVWVDDIRLSDVVNRTGYAAEIGMTLDAGAFGTLRVAATRRDPNFRQLGEQPTYLTNNDLEVAATWQLDRMLPRDFGLSIPLTVTHTSAGADPEFLSRSDIPGTSVSGLREPHASYTTYALGLRRRTPLEGPWYAPIVNNIGINAVLASTGSQSEFQRGRTRDLNVGFEFLSVNEAPAPPPSPGAFLGALARTVTGDGRQPPVALAPVSLRVTSNVERGTDRRESFLKPASASDDTAQVVAGEDYLWRTGTNLELRPLAGVVARWDAVTLRDLRDYTGLTPNDIAAGEGGASFAGLDFGLERERRMLATVSYTPAPSGWLRPRLELSSAYNMLRDPNNRSLFAGGGAAADSTSDPRLARRFGNSQRILAGAAIQLDALAGRVFGDSSWWQRVASAIRPVDVTVSRDILTAYDGAANAPSLGYQLAWGGVDDFRTMRGVLAASAGEATQVTVANSVTLPFGASLTGRVQHGVSRQWSRRQLDRQTAVDGAQDILPDVTFRWSGTPALVGALFTSLGTTVRFSRSRQAYEAPPALLGLPNELRSTRITTWPLSANAVTTWGDMALTASLARTTRVDSLPGSVGTTSASDLAADLARSFPLPASWQMKSRLRTRLSYQRTETQSYVSNVAAVGLRSRLTDNGRHAFSLNADTDVADNMTFSLQGSRILTFDNNFNRRFNQTFVSAVLQIQFFGGALR